MTLSNKLGQTNSNNVFLIVILSFSAFLIFFSGFVSFDTNDPSTFTMFKFANIVSATHYIWFDALVLAPIFIMLGIIAYDKIRGMN